VTITRALVQAGKNLDIDLLDHIIIAGNRWVSLKERRLAFDGVVCERRARYQVRDECWDHINLGVPYAHSQPPSTISLGGRP